MLTISNTHTEETDFIVAQQFVIGYMNNLSVPLFLGIIVKQMASRDANTNISDSESSTILSL
jgi:hypothetical protein